MSKKRTTLLTWLVAGTIFLFLGGNNVLAGTLYVDVATCPGMGDGSMIDPFCKIQDAVTAAAPDDTIHIAAGTYKENVVIDRNLTLQGEADPAASYGTIVDGGEEERSVISLNSGTMVILSHLTITGGKSAIGGGGIRVFNATLTLLNSTVTNNTAFGGGSGGGGILNFAFGAGNSLTLINSTVSGNTSTGDQGGGGILNFLGVVKLFNATVAENTDDASGGGGIFNVGGLVELTHTLIANNMVGFDCGGMDVGFSFGYNLDSDGTCSLVDPTDFSMGMADLGELVNNGGPTSTHALGPDSQATDGGNPLGCMDPSGAALTTDQRGVARPMDGDGEGTAVCDIGAYEFQLQVEETAPLGHLSYEVRPSDLKDYFRGWRRNFRNHKVTLDDQFAKKRKFLVLKPETLLNSASEDGGEIVDSETHLVGYSVFGHWRRRPKERNIQVENQFGAISVDLVRADRLLVPASKSEDEKPLDAPVLADVDVDHFLCYRVNRSRHSDKFEGEQVSVMDQFNEEARSFEVKRPTRLCTPVDKNGEGIKYPDRDLMCYSVKLADGEPKHKRIKGLWVNDQFGEKQVDTRKEQELCVPSKTTVSDETDKPEHNGNHRRHRDDDDDDDDKDKKDKKESKDKKKHKDDDDDDDDN
jgi:hypothetical protein